MQQCKIVFQATVREFTGILVEPGKPHKHQLEVAAHTRSNMETRVHFLA
jgi:hypothetical protein